MFPFSREWLLDLLIAIATLLPIVEAALFLSRTPKQERLKTLRRVWLLALTFSGLTVVGGLWLLMALYKPSALRPGLAFDCFLVLILFHIGVLIQSVFYWEFRRFYERWMHQPGHSSNAR